MSRDDFSKSTIETLAKRVNYHCTNPGCRRPTSGPNTEPDKATNIGVAAHIKAASPGGKRHDPNQSPEERSSIENGIWLCQDCAKLIDSDEQRFAIELLHEWKARAERSAGHAIESPGIGSRKLGLDREDKGMSWLSRRQSESYAENYKRIVAEEWADLDTLGLIIPLTGVYIQLKQIYTPPPPPLEKMPDVNTDEERMKAAGLDPKVARPQEATPVLLFEALKHSRRLTLLGEPGSGKSTTLQYIGLCCAQACLSEVLKLEETLVPIRLDLRSLGDGALEDALAAQVGHMLAVPETSRARELLDEWLEDDRVIVLLDGLDEAPEDDREGVRKEIRRFTSRTGEGKRPCRIVAASRLAGYQPLGAGFDDYQIMPLKDMEGEIRPFVGKYLNTLKPEWDEEEVGTKTEQLLRMVEGQPGLKGIANNPLLLRLAIENYASGEDPGRNRADLYRRYIEGVAWVGAKKRGAILDDGSKQVVLAKLEKLAWDLHTGEQPEPLTKEQWMLYRHQLGLIIQAPGTGQPAFTHQTFREYLVAQRLFKAWRDRERRELAWKLLQPRLHDPLWREPISLMAALLLEKNLKQARELIVYILSARSEFEDFLLRDLSLTAEILKEQIKEFPEISNNILAKLLERLSSKGVNVRLAAVRSLGKLRRPEAGDALRNTLKKDHDTSVCKEAAKALEERGEATWRATTRDVEQKALITSIHTEIDQNWRRMSVNEARDILSSAEQEVPEEEMRARAARVLGMMGSPADTKILQQVLVRDSADLVRAASVRSIGELGGTDAVKVLFNLLNNDRRMNARRTAAEALGKLGGPVVVAGLRLSLREKQTDYVRYSIARGLIEAATNLKNRVLIRRIIKQVLKLEFGINVDLIVQHYDRLVAGEPFDPLVSSGSSYSQSTKKWLIVGLLLLLTLAATLAWDAISNLIQNELYPLLKKLIQEQPLLFWPTAIAIFVLFCWLTVRISGVLDKFFSGSPGTPPVDGDTE